MDSAGSKADLATGLAIAGVALAATGVILYVTAPSQQAVAVSPIASSSSVGVVLGGRF